jgi:hypothetical protein
LLVKSPPWWSIPHSMTKLRPLAPTYVVASELGQAMFEGVDVALLDETAELPDELTEEADVSEEVCEVEDTVLELAVEEETPPVFSLAPQMEGLLPAAPRVFFR